MSSIKWQHCMGEDEDYSYSTKMESANVTQYGGDMKKWRASVDVQTEEGFEISFNKHSFDSVSDAKSWARDRLIRAHMIRDEANRILSL